MSFIYIPDSATAIFSEPEPNDIFINTRAKTDLYIRGKSEPVKIIKQTFFSKKHVPFLKSHLQKTIRLGKFDLAIKTAITLIDLDLTNLLRLFSTNLQLLEPTLREVLIRFILAANHLIYQAGQ